MYCNNSKEVETVVKQFIELCLFLDGIIYKKKDQFTKKNITNLHFIRMER